MITIGAGATRRFQLEITKLLRRANESWIVRCP